MCFFYLQKRKQSVPAKIIQEGPMPLDEEIKLLEKTVVQKDLSTSVSTTDPEDEEVKMLRKTIPPPVRQKQDEVESRLDQCRLPVYLCHLKF